MLFSNFNEIISLFNNIGAALFVMYKTPFRSIQGDTIPRMMTTGTFVPQNPESSLSTQTTTSEPATQRRASHLARVRVEK